MARLIQELLDLGRLESGVTALERQDIALRRLADRAAAAIESRAAARSVHVSVTGDPGIANVDPERLLQALLAVLDNALKFAPDGSTIHIATRPRGSHLELEVRDEGPGIAPSDLPHVFEQFYTADPSRKRGGTGLGLAIARRIVEAHGGRIAAANAPGHSGAVVLMTLPAGVAGVEVVASSSTPLSASGA